MFGHGPGEVAPAPQAQVAPPPDRSEQIGSGPARVALIVPLTQASGPSVVGTSLRNAAELAYLEAGGNDVTLLVKDDHSDPEGARAAAQAAISEGAELVIGPLFASSVREVGKVARAASKPVIAFSTDTSTAGQGLFLLSFLIENYVDRIVDFAASKGKKSIAALIPENDYGRVAEAEFQQAAARDNIRVMSHRTLPAADDDRGGAKDRRATRSNRFAVHPRTGRCDASHVSGPRLPPESTASKCRSSALAFGTTRAFSSFRRCKGRGSRRPKTAASMPSWSATAPNITLIPPASRHLPTMPYRWPRRSPIRKARSAIRKTS